jgi:hypothetical protein
MGFKAVHVHAGGSPQGLALTANSTQTIDIDALRRVMAGPFYRTTTNYAPHNLFTSANGLIAGLPKGRRDDSARYD